MPDLDEQRKFIKGLRYHLTCANDHDEQTALELLFARDARVFADHVPAAPLVAMIAEFEELEVTARRFADDWRLRGNETRAAAYTKEADTYVMFASRLHALVNP